MTRFVKIFLSIICCCVNNEVNGQIKIDSITKCYYNSFIERNQFIEEITITNNSEQDYLTWISMSPTGNQSNSFLINRFFFSKHGDFRVFDLMYDNMNYKVQYHIPDIFIKKIPKGESFCYIIIKETKESDFYDKRITIISKNEVEDHIKIPIREDFYYPWSSICLSDCFTNENDDN